MELEDSHFSQIDQGFGTVNFTWRIHQKINEKLECSSINKAYDKQNPNLRIQFSSYFAG